jgi:DNA-binding response OmpR family regulator
MNRVLLVEGRADVAEWLEGMLLEFDFEVIVATTLNAATTEANNADVCLALLEVNLGSLKSYPVADILRNRDIPFAFINSEGRGGIDRGYWSAPFLVKPFSRQQLHDLIRLLAPREPKGTRPVR